MSNAGDHNLGQREERSPRSDERRQMSRGAQTTWIAGAVLAAGAMITLTLASATPATTPSVRSSVVPNSTGEPDASTARLRESATNSMREAAERPLNGDDDALNAPRAPSVAPLNRELEMADRHAVELNEMICRETGQNCEFAKMERRQHVERYGEF